MHVRPAEKERKEWYRESVSSQHRPSQRLSVQVEAKHINKEIWCPAEPLEYVLADPRPALFWGCRPHHGNRKNKGKARGEIVSPSRVWDINEWIQFNVG